MRNKIINLLGITFIFVMIRKSATNKCYDAKICIHNGIEKCGQDGEGTLRRFIDSCDMKEYNCLQETNYKKVDLEKCENLPSLEEQSLSQANKTDNTKEKKESEKRNNTELKKAHFTDIETDLAYKDALDNFESENENNDEFVAVNDDGKSEEDDTDK